MKYILASFLFLTACQFQPLFGEVQHNVCVDPIPEAAGYQLRQELQKYFTSTSCEYTLHVTKPIMSLSDKSISNKDLVTIQRVSSSVSYTLFDRNKKSLLKSSASTDGSSAVVQNPYATVTSVEKTEANLIPILAQRIALHVTAFLNEKNK